jgi:hypothetical protein
MKLDYIAEMILINYHHTIFTIFDLSNIQIYEKEKNSHTIRIRVYNHQV